MATWRWIPEGDKFAHVVEFNQDGIVFDLKPIKPEERLRLTDQLSVNRSVWGILYTARNSFLSGDADYTDAVDRLNKLIPQLSRATGQAEKTLYELFNYVDSRAFITLEDQQERLKFGFEVLAKAPEWTPEPKPVIKSE